MRYFLMNNSYRWEEVDKESHDNPVEARSINNKASIHPHPNSLVTMQVANVGMDSIHELILLMMKGQ